MLGGIVTRSDFGERAAVVQRLADLHAARASELAALSTREMGKATAEAVGEVEYVVDIYRYYADNPPALLADEAIPSESSDAVTRKAPIGALLGIMPWNYPYYQVARFAGPNLLRADAASRVVRRQSTVVRGAARLTLIGQAAVGG